MIVCVDSLHAEARATHQSTAVLFCKLTVPVSVLAASLILTVYGIMVEAIYQNYMKSGMFFGSF